MSENSNYGSDRSDLGKDESDSLESMMHMFSIKVEYYRSLEYSLKWKDSMNPKRSSKRLKTSKEQDSSGSSKESIQRRLEGKRQQKEKKKTQAGDRRISADKLSNNDIIDIIDQKHQLEEKPEENGHLVEVADEGEEQLDDDEVSVTSSVMSGPSLPYNISTEKPQILCSACRKLYQKAKRMKAPLKDKLLDTNPKSMTCDQWILLKPWRSKKMPNIRGNQLVLIQLIRKIRLVNKSMKKSELAAEEVCSRPHLFLQRNIRRCFKVPLKKEKTKNRRKRSREDTQASRVAKQQRLHNNHRRPISSGFTHNNSLEPMSSLCGTLSFESELEDSNLTIKVPPVSSTLETSDKIKDFPKQSVPKRGGGFKDLLAQLRGNSSIIIRETRY